MNAAGGGNSTQAIDRDMRLSKMNSHMSFGNPYSGEQACRASITCRNGGPVDDAKECLAKYFRQIDNRLFEHFSDPCVPIVLAGIERSFPLYRPATRNRTRLEQEISVDPDDQNMREFHNKPWELVVGGSTAGSCEE